VKQAFVEQFEAGPSAAAPPVPVAWQPRPTAHPGQADPIARGSASPWDLVLRPLRRLGLRRAGVLLLALLGALAGHTAGAWAVNLSVNGEVTYHAAELFVDYWNGLGDRPFDPDEHQAWVERTLVPATTARLEALSGSRDWYAHLASACSLLGLLGALVALVRPWRGALVLLIAAAGVFTPVAILPAAEPFQLLRLATLPAALLFVLAALQAPPYRISDRERIQRTAISYADPSLS
jgi:hypothetical protein